VSIPVLRKDFIIDERQLAESCALGADAVLLIAAVLKERLPVFVDLAREYGLEPLVEVHTRSDVEIALSTNAELIGINNRNLSTLRIDRSTTRLLSESVRSAGRMIVSESGMMTGDDVREMKPYCDAFLIVHQSWHMIARKRNWRSSYAHKMLRDNKSRGCNLCRGLWGRRNRCCRMFSPSVRSVSLERAQEIFDSTGPFTTTVAVTHTTSLSDLEQILALQPDALQISYPFTFRNKPGPKVIRVIGRTIRSLQTVMHSLWMRAMQRQTI